MSSIRSASGRSADAHASISTTASNSRARSNSGEAAGVRAGLAAPARNRCASAGASRATSSGHRASAGGLAAASARASSPSSSVHMPNGAAPPPRSSAAQARRGGARALRAGRAARARAGSCRSRPPPRARPRRRCRRVRGPRRRAARRAPRRGPPGAAAGRCGRRRRRRSRRRRRRGRGPRARRRARRRRRAGPRRRRRARRCPSPRVRGREVGAGGADGLHHGAGGRRGREGEGPPHPVAEPRVGGEGGAAVAGRVEAPDEVAVSGLAERVQLRAAAVEADRGHEVAARLGRAAGGLERVHPALGVLVAGGEDPLLVDAGEQLARVQGERGLGAPRAGEALELEQVHPHLQARRPEPDLVARRHEDAAVVVQRPPQRPHRAAQARAGAGVEDVGPQARGDGGARLQARVERKPGEDGADLGARRQHGGPAIQLDREVAEHADPQHVASLLPGDRRGQRLRATGSPAHGNGGHRGGAAPGPTPSMPVLTFARAGPRRRL